MPTGRDPTAGRRRAVAIWRKTEVNDPEELRALAAAPYIRVRAVVTIGLLGTADIQRIQDFSPIHLDADDRKPGNKRV
jgi:hypothetical protein